MWCLFQEIIVIIYYQVIIVIKYYQGILPFD